MATRICKICGREYRVCPTCKAVKSFAPWRLLVCDPQEYQLFATLSQYDYDKNAKDAASAMDMIGIDDTTIKTYIPEVQQQIAEIRNRTKATTKKTASKQQNKE